MSDLDNVGKSLPLKYDAGIYLFTQHIYDIPTGTFIINHNYTYVNSRLINKLTSRDM